MEEQYDEDGILINDEDHLDSNLVNSVHKILDIKKKRTIRREAVNNVEEFVAVKRKHGSSLNKLLETVKESGEEKTTEKVAKLVKAPSDKNLKTLEAPLDKPQALKAKRTVLYDNVKKDVSRFNAIVYHNRVAEQLVFPMNEQKAKKYSAKERFADYVPMTPLEEEMARVLYGEEYVKQKKAEMEKPKGPTDAESYALSVEEALNLHSEMARLKAQQSYQMAKAKRQNKIKSKKYHRLLRKEKIKKQLKQFEELQKKDPDAAMDKLEELNKSRIIERMSLKHRNTSKWAKMHAARAKYDKDSRIALAEQLQISKDLTQKVQDSSEEEDDGDLEFPQLVKSSMENPWMLRPEVRDNEKMQLYYCGYKKLWEEINAKQRREQQQKASSKVFPEDASLDIVKKLDPNDEVPNSGSAKKLQKTNLKRRKQKAIAELKPSNSKTNKKLKGSLFDGDEKDFTNLDLEMMIEQAEDKIKNEASAKLRKLTKEERLEKKALARRKKKQSSLKAKKKSKKKGDADEIRELEVDATSQLLENGISLDPPSQANSTSNQPEPTPQKTLDPNNFLKITNTKPEKSRKVFNFEKYDEGSESEDQDDSQKNLIAEAFEDDDVVDEFQRKKQEQIASSQPADIDLTLPGWGEWGGKGILPSAKKRARFTIRAAPPPPRKDARLSHVILNEEAGEQIKEHLVRQLPFQFRRVKDFERSIRAPVGSTWLPGKAVKDMTAPKVITRLGSVIQPLDEDVLVKKQELRVPMSIKRLSKVKK